MIARLVVPLLQRGGEDGGVREGQPDLARRFLTPWGEADGKDVLRLDVLADERPAVVLRQEPKGEEGDVNPLLVQVERLENLGGRVRVADVQ